MCGSDDKTYPNECVLKIAICKSQGTISKAHNGPCSKFNHLYCIYRNSTYQGNEKVKSFGGFIVLVKNAICPAFCSFVYKPVCGSNKVTYPNLCKLRFADCEFEDDEKITLKYQGPCRSGIKIVYSYFTTFV